MNGFAKGHTRERETLRAFLLRVVLPRSAYVLILVIAACTSAFYGFQYLLPGTPLAAILPVTFVSIYAVYVGSLLVSAVDHWHNAQEALDILNDS